jgi:hypothetical protein
MSLAFTITPSALIVSGKTFHVKEHLKKLGGKWATNAWSLPLNADTPVNRADLEAAATEAITAEKLVNAAARAYAKSPAGIAAATAAELQFARRAGWTCCDDARVVDYKRGHCSCLTHGLHVKGRLYTGD